MPSTRASISKASKRPKINIIPPKQLFVDLTHDDTKTPSPKHQLSSPSAPNAPSKTPSTKGTFSSSIDYTPKSPTSSTLPSTNDYLNLPTSPPPRVPSLPLTQEHTSMDITLTLSPIIPLDVQFNTPSHSPPIFGHLIPWNLLKYLVDEFTYLLPLFVEAKSVVEAVLASLVFEVIELWMCCYKTRCETCHLDEQNPNCLEDWENLDFQDLVVDGWVNGNGSNPSGGFGKPGGGRETRGGGDGLEGLDGQLSMV
ncbi:hypothetical protein Tco_0503376 [Tanacetum coccineum]